MHAFPHRESTRADTGICPVAGKWAPWGPQGPPLGPPGAPEAAQEKPGGHGACPGPPREAPGTNPGIFAKKRDFDILAGNLIGRICVFLGRFGKFEYVSVA